MRVILKLSAFLLTSFFFLFIASAVLVAAIILGKRGTRLLPQCTMVWAKIMVYIVGIRIKKPYSERSALSKNFLIVSNHQSYLDIIVIASMVPTLFVAKKEVRQWWLLGWLASLGGTIYIDRKTFRGGIQAAAAITSSLNSGVNVLVFPEGTSTNGTSILPFKPSLLTSAIDSQTAVLPITISYRNVNGRTLDKMSRDIVCWYGSMEFVPHFLSVLKQQSIDAAIAVHPALKTGQYRSAKEMADACHRSVQTGMAVLSGNISTDNEEVSQHILDHLGIQQPE